jgi:UDP-N-acetylglucosamine:LPS N-acetylglucosamine transferase
MTAQARRKLMAVASGGGHWIQLLRLAPAFIDFEVIFVTVDEGYRSQVAGARFYVISDASRWNKFGLLRMACELGAILLKERPEIVISTGAAPGYVALRIAHALRARTIWLDSMANVSELSLSGAKVGRYADLWLTQWPHLAGPRGPYYAGSVL